MDREPEVDDAAELVRRAGAGDDAAARDLVTRLYPVVARVVQGRLPRRASVEDMAQEVFMKMFARLDQYRGQVPMEHWVSRIAVTTCIDHLRAQRRRPELRMADLTEEEQGALERAMRDESEAPAPDAAEAGSARDVLDAMLARLPAKDQMVVRMLDLEQRSVAEIAHETGWSQTLVKVRAFRARRKLRRMMAGMREELLG